MANLAISIALAILLQSTTAEPEGSTAKRISPTYSSPFQSSLPIPPVARVAATYTDPATGTPIDFYELEVKNFSHQIYPDLGAAQLTGYNGSFPGPTFRVERGRQTLVRVVNNADQQATNLHLHGSYTRSPWDGWALDEIKKGESKDYFYPNQANARTLWYHDHADRHNAANVYSGLAGMYQIVDTKEDAAAGLPSGDAYDIPLILSAHFFNADGGLSDVSKEKTSTYGDTFLVNGAIQPFFAVEPRKYRFRVLNAALSRAFNLGLRAADSDVPIKMTVVGSDGGLRGSPIDTESLMTGMADRWDIVIDFAPLLDKNATLTTKNMWTDTAYPGTEELLRFVVGTTVTSHERNGPISRTLKVDDTFTEAEIQAATARSITFDSHHDRVWGINGRHMDDPMKRVMFRPPLGTVEKYTISSKGMNMMMKTKRQTLDSTLTPAKKNETNPANWNWNDMVDTMNNMGFRGGMSAADNYRDRHTRRSRSKRQMMGMMGSSSATKAINEWTHVLHLHLVDLKIISRRKEDPSKPDGRSKLEPYEEGSIKDVALIGGNEVVEVLARYQPYPGLYMMHCHNLIHEDNGMMGTFNATALKGLNYDDLTLGLEDPLDTRFIAKPAQKTDLQEIVQKVLPYYTSLRAYSTDEKALSQAEAKFWDGKQIPSAKDTGPPPQAGGGMMSMMGGGAKSNPAPAPKPVPVSVPIVATPAVQADKTPTTGMSGMNSMMMGGTHSSHHAAGAPKQNPGNEMNMSGMMSSSAPKKGNDDKGRWGIRLL